MKYKVDPYSTYIHDRSLSWLGTDTAMASGGVKLVPSAQASSLSEIFAAMRIKCKPSHIIG